LPEAWDSPKFSLDFPFFQNIKGEWKCVQVRRMVVFQGELPFSIDVKGGENFVGRGVMMAGGVLVLPSMP